MGIESSAVVGDTLSTTDLFEELYQLVNSMLLSEGEKNKAVYARQVYKIMCALSSDDMAIGRVFDIQADAWRLFKNYNDKIHSMGMYSPLLPLLSEKSIISIVKENLTNLSHESVDKRKNACSGLVFCLSALPPLLVDYGVPGLLNYDVACSSSESSSKKINDLIDTVNSSDFVKAEDSVRVETYRHIVAASAHVHGEPLGKLIAYLINKACSVYNKSGSEHERDFVGLENACAELLDLSLSEMVATLINRARYDSSIDNKVTFIAQSNIGNLNDSLMADAVSLILSTDEDVTEITNQMLVAICVFSSSEDAGFLIHALIRDSCDDRMLNVREAVCVRLAAASVFSSSEKLTQKVEYLVKRCENTDTDICEAACKALTVLVSRVSGDTMDLIVTFLIGKSNDQPVSVRLAACKGLVAASFHASGNALVKLITCLINKFNDTQTEVCKLAHKGLKAGVSRASSEILIASARAAKASSMAALIGLIGATISDRADICAAAFKELATVIAQSSGEILTWLVTWLIERIASKKDDINKAALEALSFLKSYAPVGASVHVSKESLNVLIAYLLEKLNDEDSDVRVTAYSGLSAASAYISEECLNMLIARLLEKLDDDEPDTRVAACNGLSAVSVHASKEYLKALIMGLMTTVDSNSELPDVRVAACNGLSAASAYASEEYLEQIIIYLLENLYDENIGVCIAVCNGLSAASAHASEKHLEELINHLMNVVNFSNDKNTGICVAACNGLSAASAYVSREDLKPLIVCLLGKLNDKDPDIRIAVHNGLSAASVRASKECLEMLAVRLMEKVDLDNSISNVIRKVFNSMTIRNPKNDSEWVSKFLVEKISHDNVSVRTAACIELESMSTHISNDSLMDVAKKLMSGNKHNCLNFHEATYRIFAIACAQATEKCVSILIDDLIEQAENFDDNDSSDGIHVWKSLEIVSAYATGKCLISLLNFWIEIANSDVDYLREFACQGMAAASAHATGENLGKLVCCLIKKTGDNNPTVCIAAYKGLSAVSTLVEDSFFLRIMAIFINKKTKEKLREFKMKPDMWLAEIAASTRVKGKGIFLLISHLLKENNVADSCDFHKQLWQMLHKTENTEGAAVFVRQIADTKVHSIPLYKTMLSFPMKIDKIYDLPPEEETNMFKAFQECHEFLSGLKMSSCLIAHQRCTTNSKLS